VALAKGIPLLIRSTPRDRTVEKKRKTKKRKTKKHLRESSPRANEPDHHLEGKRKTTFGVLIEMT
jgi:hypothetical protein